MPFTHTAAAFLVSLSCALLTASCVQTPGGTAGADNNTVTAAEGIEGLDFPGPSPTAITPCEEACWVLYLAACAVYKKKGLGSACYAEAMEEYVRCARRCREGGD
jgi:hypothetical protein